MTADRDLDRRLVTWLDERAATHVPDGLLERSLGRVGATRQRPGWLVRDRWRAMPMPRRSWPRPMLVRLAAAAAIGVLAVGGTFLLLGPGQGSVVGPGTSPTASPSPTVPTSTPTSTPSPTPRIGLPGPIGDGRQVHTATTLANGRVLVAGGYDVRDVALGSASLYDPGTDTFSSTGSLASARGLHTATLLADGRVLVAGGGPASWSVGGDYLASAELYDPRSGTFTPTGPMTTQREDHTATLLADGRVLITGGSDQGSHTVASAEIYDPKTGTFTPTGSMNTARGFHTATLLADGRVLIAGGDAAAWADAGPFLASAEIYDPKTGTFTPTGPMADGRGFHAATLLADGRVLATGGVTYGGAAAAGGISLASAELYDPKTGTFTATGPMTNGRVYHTATLLPDGRVLVAGGCPNGRVYSNNPHFLTSAELYDPVTGAFTATGPMAEGRTWQAASLLADGRVLVTGGYGDLAPLASAEIYNPGTGRFSAAGSGS